jgi:hypothetical protein
VQIGPSQSNQNLEDFEFADNPLSLSSNAYRILAVRQLSSLLQLNRSFCPNSSDVVTSVDASLTSFLLHLPDEKKCPLDKHGRLDEMMFQAHMIING